MGYSSATAVADLVDNSISANASIVDVNFVWRDDAPHVLVTDNGRGMDRGRLIAAMRLGSDPRTIREEGDLGRFGLGLKTASLSQAAIMTVVSKELGGSPVAARWDLAEIESNSDWQLQEADPSKFGVDPEMLDAFASGTIVRWDQLDRLLGPQGSIDTFFAVAETVGRHLGMTYHRLLAGGDVEIRLNGAPVVPWSPIADEYAELFEECAIGPEARTVCKTYLVAAPSTLTEEQARRAAGPLDWIQQQGFYIYRQRRLIVAGGWLGLGPGERAWRLDPRYNLARLTIDISNADDEAWSVDLKKSAAEPPPALRTELLRLAQRVRRRSVSRARSLLASPTGAPDEGGSAFAPIWVAVTAATTAPYRLNRRHPLVSQVRRALPDAGPLRLLLDFLERTAPLPPVSASAGLDMATTASRVAEEADVRRLLLTVYPNYRRILRLSKEDACERLFTQTHFRNHRDLVLDAIERIELDMLSVL